MEGYKTNLESCYRKSDSILSVSYSKNIRWLNHLALGHSGILIALIELAPLEENMNPLLFSDQRVCQQLNAGHGNKVFGETLSDYPLELYAES